MYQRSHLGALKKCRLNKMGGKLFMNKGLLVKKLGQTFVDLPEAQIQYMVHVLLQLLAKSLIDRERIEIRGFGSMQRKDYAPRRAHIPRSGVYKMTKIRSKPVFRASSVILRSLSQPD